MDVTLTQQKERLERLKASCLSTGISLTARAARALRGPEASDLSIHEYPTTGGLTFVLSNEVYINAPFDEPFCENADVVFDVSEDDEGFRVSYRGASFPVERVLPLPGYLLARDAMGRRVTDVMMSHADRLRCSPFVGCAYDCGFCDLPGETYEGRDAERILAAVQVAAADANLPPRHMLISGGSPRKAHYAFFAETCESIIQGSPIPVDIMMSPMIDGTGFIDRMIDAGVEGFSINIELFSDDAGRAYLGNKYRTTRDHFDTFIAHAVDRLGSSGHVRSLIIPGLEPMEATLAGVEHLASMGVDPVLSPFRPASGTELSHLSPPSADDIYELLQEARSIAAKYDVNLGPGCIPCQHNTLTLPWDTRDSE